ncbi:hypothetical protein HDU85_003874 [Gaertneriomyces sp. JEL0708]|nr:hypothetical protein HDU85_003874 [Gaertneriomyces sp. JEL0708]
MTTKPNVLVLGGIGFIGRNLVEYLVTKEVCGFVRVVDKAVPATAYLADRYKNVLENPIVEFRQANLTNPTAVSKAFDLPTHLPSSPSTALPTSTNQFDYVFNLAAETKYGQSESVYEERIVSLAALCAGEAEKRNVAFIELGTCQVYESDKKPSGEEGKIKPWTMLAKAKWKAEEEVRKLTGSGLRSVVVRCPIVWGEGDVAGLTPRFIIGAVYRHLSEKMELLWTKDLKMYTVHVRDVCRALWFLTALKSQGGGRDKPVEAGCEVYNVVDKNETDQGKVNEIVGALFGIDTGFQGTVISQFAKLNLESVTEDVNDKHLAPWSELCKAGGVTSTPLTPYLDKELLKDNALSVDGSKLDKMGFVYEVPNVTREGVKRVVEDWVREGWWPKGTLKE